MKHDRAIEITKHRVTLTNDELKLAIKEFIERRDHTIQMPDEFSCRPYEGLRLFSSARVFVEWEDYK
jgi:tRNA U55 pseudouridine synthase TruB